jgi:phosphoserine aminotransferase
MLPEAVLEQAKAEMLDWRGSGMAVMEMSHRGKEFVSIAEQAEADSARTDEHPRPLQGAVSARRCVQPVRDGSDEPAARQDQSRLSQHRHVVEESHLRGQEIRSGQRGRQFRGGQLYHRSGPRHLEMRPRSRLSALHAERDHQWRRDAHRSRGGVPLAADLSSTLLSRPLDVSRFGVIYAGAQKNIGPAGLTIVIVREDLIGQTVAGTPTMLDYAVMAKEGSMYNTPPTYAWYIAGLVFQWLKAQGGLAAMGECNRAKAELLYRTIDESGFYRNPVDPAYRSWMNVPFTLPDEALDKPFLAEAKTAGLLTLAGHRSVGGMRASIYNAVPLAGVKALVDFMADFQKRHG